MTACVSVGEGPVTHYVKLGEKKVMVQLSLLKVSVLAIVRFLTMGLE